MVVLSALTVIALLSRLALCAGNTALQNPAELEADVMTVMPSSVTDTSMDGLAHPQIGAGLPCCKIICDPNTFEILSGWDDIDARQKAPRCIA